VRDPSGVSVHYGMTSSGELGVLRDGLGNQTVFNYDAQHNRTAMMLPSGAVWRYTYDTRGNPLSVRDPLNNTTSYQYGSYDRVTLVQDPLGNQRTTVTTRGAT
jgi:YD repeat-containing protein